MTIVNCIVITINIPIIVIVIINQYHCCCKYIMNLKQKKTDAEMPFLGL